MDIPQGTSSHKQAKAFAKQIHNSWGVGHKGCNDGVVLFLSITDRQAYISTGPGARKSLTDVKASTVIDEMKPFLRSRFYGAGVNHAINKIGEALRPQTWDEWIFDYLPIFIFVALSVGLILYDWRRQAKASKYKDCKAILEQLMHDQAAIRENKYGCTSCPICFASFEDVKDTKAQESSDDSAQSSTSSQEKQKPLELPCGHTFCFSCIKGWVEQKKSTCPICRKPISDALEMGPQSVTRPSPASRHHTRAQWDADSYAEEFRFRLHNIRRRYPEFVSRSMIDEWESDHRLGRPFCFEDHSCIRRLNSTYIPQSSYQARQSSSTDYSNVPVQAAGSFGGGSCSPSSGGAGGSW